MSDDISNDTPDNRLDDRLPDDMRQQPVRCGPRNLISDVSGLMVGNSEDRDAHSGVTVVVPGGPAVGAVSVPGGGPGTRETDVLQPANLVDKVDAIVLSGGSVFGLDAASGVTADLAARGRGFPTGAPLPSPIVPAAVLFDMTNGGNKQWGDTPPYHALGRQALNNCRADFTLGTAGAGFGTQAGQVKGGLGSASAQIGDGPQSHPGMVGALIAANPLGAVVDAKGRFWAQPQALTIDGQPEFGGPGKLQDAAEMADQHPLTGSKLSGLAAGVNTSIGVVAVEADLTPAEAHRLAIMAQDGLARAIMPVHTPFDGDTIFVLATGTKRLADADMRPLALTILGALAAQCVARAVARAIWLATDLGEQKSWHSVFTQ